MKATPLGMWLKRWGTKPHAHKPYTLGMLEHEVEAIDTVVCGLSCEEVAALGLAPLEDGQTRRIVARYVKNG